MAPLSSLKKERERRFEYFLINSRHIGLIYNQIIFSPEINLKIKLQTLCIIESNIIKEMIIRQLKQFDELIIWIALHSKDTYILLKSKRKGKKNTERTAMLLVTFIGKI